MASEALEQGVANKDDVHNLYLITPKKIQSVVDELYGLDRTVYDYLWDRGEISKNAVDTIVKQMLDGNMGVESFTDVCLELGLIKNDKITELSLEVDPSELADKELIEPSIPIDVLKLHKIMLNATTEKMVYLSTLRSPVLAEQALKKYFPGLGFYFTPANLNRVNRYLKEIESYYREKGTLLEALIKKGIREKVTDIHIIPTYTGYMIQNRYLGTLYTERVGGDDEYFSILAKLKVESKMDINERRRPMSGAFMVMSNGRRVDLRTETIPTAIGNKEAAVIRILNADDTNSNLDELGITQIAEFKKAISAENGLVLVCGVTGSGKSTTLMAAIRTGKDRYSESIISLEDPVENKLPSIKQVPINEAAGLTFPVGLRSAMRLDPDTILVGEIRDEETLKIAFRASETGHLVLATLHTSDIRTTIDRLVGLGADRGHLESQIRGIIVQKLIKVKCTTCDGTGKVMEAVEFEEPEEQQCRKCNGRFYTGRTIVAECVYINGPEKAKQLMDRDVAPWWPTKMDDAFGKYKQGITDQREFINAFGEEGRVMLLEKGEEIHSER
jgi:general secretion pathway protein E